MNPRSARECLPVKPFFNLSLLFCSGKFLLLIALVNGLFAAGQNCPPPFNFNFPKSATVCPGYSVTLSSGGPATYTWTGSLPAPVVSSSIFVSSGVYYFTYSHPTFTSCVYIDTVVVSLSQSLNIQLSLSSPTTCIESNDPKQSKPVVIIASGAANYVWSPYDPAIMTYSLGSSVSVRPPASACYTVVGSTSNCSGQSSVCISVGGQYTIAAAPHQQTICAGEQLMLTVTGIGSNTFAPGLPVKYLWKESAAAGSINTPSSMATSVSPLVSTTYSVEMWDGQGCVSQVKAVSVEVQECTGMRENDLKASLHFDRSVNRLIIRNNHEFLEVLIYDVMGRKIAEKECREESCALSMEGMEHSVLIVRMISSDGKSKVIRLSTL